MAGTMLGSAVDNLDQNPRFHVKTRKVKEKIPHPHMDKIEEE